MENRLNAVHTGVKSPLTAAFTLIELSIVLVIIGLIAGGVLVGQDLISTAATRAQISQIEKYQTAVNTFRGKYGYLPGDIPDPNAQTFGFLPRGQHTGEGDGNGILEGVSSDAAGANLGIYMSTGETVMFWNDLSVASLVDGGLTAGRSSTVPAANVTATTSPSISNYFPKARIGNGNYVYAWSGGWQIYNVTDLSDQTNYFSITTVSLITTGGPLANYVGLTVQQAYNIDVKIDDGYPQSGNVQSFMQNGIWADASQGSHENGLFSVVGGGTNPGFYGPVTDVSQAAGDSNSPYTCYDYQNPASPSLPLVYSMAENASQINCALSFRFE